MNEPIEVPSLNEIHVPLPAMSVNETTTIEFEPSDVLQLQSEANARKKTNPLASYLLVSLCPSSPSLPPAPAIRECCN